MAKRTVNIADDLLPVIDTLGMPFSQWITEQLRLHAAAAATPYAEQERPSAEQSVATGRRMERSAPW